MGFFDKVKNMFTEEVEEDEVKVEKIQKDVKKINIESPGVKKTDDSEFNKRLKTFSTVNEVKEERKPVFFTDRDFDDLVREPKKMETIRPKRETYSGFKKEEKQEINSFKPSPIISPVYGVLDKNYKKEDIVSKKEEKHVDGLLSDDLSVDSIRNKAFGSLEDELENTLFSKKSILFSDKEKNETEESDFFEELEKESEPDIMDKINENMVDDNDQKLKELEDITVDLGKEIDTLINKKEKIENNKQEDNDLFGLIDSMYEGEDK